VDFREAREDPEWREALYGRRDLPEDGKRLGYLAERLFVSLGAQAVGMCEKGAKRLLDLAILAIPAELSQRTRRFLQRVSRCYVWGFDAECAVFCRSVVEASFQDVVPDEACRSALGDGARVNLSNRIEAAHRKMLVSDTVRDAAHRVRDAGNSAVHDTPDTSFDAFHIISDTMCILESLG